VTATNATGSAARTLTLRVADAPAVTPTPTVAATPSPTPIPVLDRTAPRMSQLKWPQGPSALKTLLKKRQLVVALAVDERSTLASDVLVTSSTATRLKLKGKSVKVGAKRYVLLGASKAMTAVGAVKLTIKVSSATAKRLRHARTLPLVVEVSAADAAGNRGTARKTLTLRAGK
jgi:hypothetical protein